MTGKDKAYIYHQRIFGCLLDTLFSNKARSLNILYASNIINDLFKIGDSLLSRITLQIIETYKDNVRKRPYSRFYIFGYFISRS